VSLRQTATGLLARGERLQLATAISMLILAAACTTSSINTGGSPASSSSASTSPGGSASAGPASASPSGGSPSASNPGGSASNGVPVVDLVFTGSSAFTIKGNVGTCTPSTYNGEQTWGVSITNRDVPKLGPGILLGASGTTVSFKWVVQGPGGYQRPVSGGTWNVSADRKTYTIDSDLEVVKTDAGFGPGPEHVSGTVVCP
jgi:hypothetical protein